MQTVGGVEEQELAYLVSLSYVFRNSDNEEIATGEVSYVAAYRVADGVQLTDHQVEEYGQHGALFQVHPFLREHLATMCQRSGLAAYPLPILLHDPADAAQAMAD